MPADGDSPQELPSEENWPEILSLDLRTTTALSVANFLTRAKLDTKLDAACKIKAERDKLEKSNIGLSLKTLISRNKEYFGRAARSYVTFLFKSFQGLEGLTNDLVKGLGCFDLEILLLGPIAHASYCHSQLFTSFRLRGFFTLDQETACGEDYLSFLDDLRQTFPDLVHPTLFNADTVKFLVELPSLHSRPLLYKLFHLACLCLDEPFPVLTTVRFGSVDSDNPTSSLIDVILPVQSYFSNVPYGNEAVTSVAVFRRLELDFGASGLADTYCPWDSVEFFGRSKILEQLDPETTRPRVSTSVSFSKSPGGAGFRGSSKSPVKKDSQKSKQSLSPIGKNLSTARSSKL